jgi:Flp pilus assembly protein TadB
MTNQIILLLFVLPVLSGLLLWRVSRFDRRRQFVQQRLHALTLGRDNVEAPPQLAKARRATTSGAVFQFPNKITASMDAAFEAAGNRIGLMHLVVAGLIAGTIVTLFTSRLLALDSVLVMLSSVTAAATAPVAVLRIAQSRYRNRFLNVFPDALDLIGRAVRAGLPVNEALAVAGREMADPVGSELRRVLDETQIGVQMIDALNQTADRVRVADFRFLVVALALQQKTGGSLAETLANLSGVIRGRKALRLKARALSAEARAGAAVLAALPILVGGYMYLVNRDFASALFVDPRGRFMVGIAVLSLITGLITMNVMVKRAVR